MLFSITANDPVTDSSPAERAELPSAVSPKGSYFRYLTAAYNRAAAYPIGPCPPTEWYRPAAPWIGRLILPEPEERARVQGVVMEVQYADAPYTDLIGTRVRLRWAETPEAQQRFWSVTRSVEFDREAKKYRTKGYVLPERLNHWPLVNPFESLAGAIPADEMIVRLPEPVVVQRRPDDGGTPILYLSGEPVQTTGRFYALVQFVGPSFDTPETGAYSVVHYDKKSRSFDGLRETVLLNDTVPDRANVHPAVREGIERSPLNTDGWYIYGALNTAGQFVVQSLVPRRLMRLEPTETITERDAKFRFLRRSEWRKRAVHGTISSTLLCPEGTTPDAEIERWREGDVALVVHLYGKYLRKDWFWQRFLLTWGHFSFGLARVVREPLTDELRFDITYHQVYVHTDSGIISGTHDWTRYTGDRQFGFLGTHPTQDVLIRLDCFTEPLPLSDAPFVPPTPLTQLTFELEKMMARYRIADGRGGHRISPSNNCTQDSSQALYAAIKGIEFTLRARSEGMDALPPTSTDAYRITNLARLGRDLRRKLLPLGAARADWEWGAATIGSSLSENPFRSVWMAARTWHSVFPSVAVRHIVGTFLRHGASAWILRTHLVGGDDPTIEPCVPNV